MGFFKSLFNDIKLNNTPVGDYKGKLNDYMNFISLHSFGQSNISEETAERKAIALSNELYELSERLDRNATFTIYLPKADLNLNVATSVKLIELLQIAFQSKKEINEQLLTHIIEFKIKN